MQSLWVLSPVWFYLVRLSHSFLAIVQDFRSFFTLINFYLVRYRKKVVYKNLEEFVSGKRPERKLT